MRNSLLRPFKTASVVAETAGIATLADRLLEPQDAVQTARGLYSVQIKA